MSATHPAFASRPATDADLPAWRGLLAAAGLPVEGIDACLRDCLCLCHDGDVVAAGAIEPLDDAVLLRSVVVAPAWRRSGLGGRVVDALEARARESGCEQVWLLTDSAADWFAARGYERREREQAPPGVRAHAQFRELCPASAALMCRRL